MPYTDYTYAFTCTLPYTTTGHRGDEPLGL